MRPMYRSHFSCVFLAKPLKTEPPEPKMISLIYPMKESPTVVVPVSAVAITPPILAL